MRGELIEKIPWWSLEDWVHFGGLAEPSPKPLTEEFKSVVQRIPQPTRPLTQIGGRRNWPRSRVQGNGAESGWQAVRKFNEQKAEEDNNLEREVQR